MTSPSRVDARHLAVLVFLQMLPATLVAPAIRPLFAAHHGGAEGPMHAFMSLGMLGAVVAAPVIGALLDRGASRRRMLGALAFADAVLLAACAAPAPTPLILVLRLGEGAAHVGAMTLLMAEAAAVGRRTGDPRAVAAAGGAVMLAVAAGSMIGAALLGLGVRAPFWAGAGLAALVAVYGPRHLGAAVVAARPTARELVRVARVLWVPATAAFAGRFTVGCLIVTFSLYAHHVHGLSDGEVGALFATLTVPFALATYPAARLASVVPRAWILGGGVAAYAVALALLPLAPTAALAPLLITAGLGSAAIFAATLGYAAELGAGARASAMAVFNAAGCLGMLLGPAAAGITTAIVRAELGPAAGYRAAFVVAAVALVGWLAATARWRRDRAATERAAVAAAGAGAVARS